MLVRMNALLSCAWPDIVGGRYYWTHTAYMKTTDWSNNLQQMNNWRARVLIGYTTQVLYHGTRMIDPDDGTVVFQETNVDGQPGGRTPFANFSLLIAGRWRYEAADGSTGYHLHRYPTDLDWVEGDQWNATGLSRLQAVAGSMYAPGHIYSRSGSLVTGWGVAGMIAEWQLRHGTKRRNSRFWLP